MPKFFMQWSSKRNINEIHFNILLSNLIVVIVLIAVGKNTSMLDIIPHQCISQALFHIDCPGCGITTGLLFFFHLQFEEAYKSNPISILIGLFIIIQIIIRFVAIIRKKLSLKIMKLSSLVNHILIAILLTNYIFKLINH